MEPYSPANMSSLPVELTDDRCVSAHPRVRSAARASASPAASPPPAGAGGRSPHATWRMAVVCAVLLLVLAAVFIPSIHTAWRMSGGTLTASSWGKAIGTFLLNGGLPPTDQALLGGTQAGGTEADGTTGTRPSSTAPAGTDESEVEPTPSESIREPESDSTVGAETAPAADATTGGALRETVTGANDDTRHDPSDTPSSDSTAESVTAELATVEATTSDNAETVTTPPDETTVPVPDGCVAITTVDGSEPTRGAGYIINTAGSLPQSLPTGRLWSTTAPPTVLIVNTHPYEGYGDGGAWYDPASGGLAQTDSPNDPDGVVALGAALARTLRGQGVTVIHLRVSVSAGETASEIYDRTEAQIRYYCRLYPDIGLVLDLRRSAELTEQGDILRTEGTYRASACAQLRLSVSAGRAQTAVTRDLAVAIALRERLWAEAPSISRPVWVRGGGGLASELTDVAVLTVELGAAGNTYAEAARLIEPLGWAVARAVLGEG